jgi:hypothetical protein
MQHIVGLQLARRDDGKTLARELIEDSQHAEYPSVLRSVPRLRGDRLWTKS